MRSERYLINSKLSYHKADKILFVVYVRVKNVVNVTKGKGIVVYMAKDNTFFVAHKDYINPKTKTPSMEDPIPVTRKEELWEVVNDIYDKVYKKP